MPNSTAFPRQIYKYPSLRSACVRSFILSLGISADPKVPRVRLGTFGRCLEILVQPGDESLSTRRRNCPRGNVEGELQQIDHRNFQPQANPYSPPGHSPPKSSLNPILLNPSASHGPDSLPRPFSSLIFLASMATRLRIGHHTRALRLLEGLGNRSSEAGAGRMATYAPSMVKRIALWEVGRLEWLTGVGGLRG